MWLCLVLMSHFKKWPRYKLVYGYLLDMKAYVKDCRKKWSLPLIPEYPENPHMLAAPVYEKIFGEHPPIVASIERFETTARAHIPLRRNSKLITIEAKSLKGDESPKRAAPPPVNAEPDEAEHIPKWAKLLLDKKKDAAPEAVSSAVPVRVKPLASSQEIPEDMPPWAVKFFGLHVGPASSEPLPEATQTSIPKGVRPNLYFRSGLQVATAAGAETGGAPGPKVEDTGSKAGAPDADKDDAVGDKPRKTCAELEAEYKLAHAKVAAAKAKARSELASEKAKAKAELAAL